MHLYKHHLGDYARHTGTLTCSDHGAYRQLLDHLYSTEKPLPLDLGECCVIARAFSVAERASVKKVLERHFIKTERGYTHPRVEEEIAAYHARAEHNRIVGASGGRPRGKASGLDGDERQNPEKTRTVSRPKPKSPQNGNPEETLANNQEPYTPSLRSGVSGARRARVPLPDGFSVSDRVRAWAEKRGFDRLDEHLEAFRFTAQKHAYAYADWDAALMEAIREDWAQLRAAPRAGGAKVTDLWQTSPAGIERKGRELGLEARPGETSASYRDRIIAAVAQGRAA